jgi:hypothetical protein
MKNKIILAIAIIFTLSASAQFNVGMSAGFARSTPFAVLNVGYSFKPEVINSERFAPEVQYDQRFYMSKRVDRPAYLGIKLGVSYLLKKDNQKLWFLTGPSYRLASNDNKSLNYWTYGYGFRYTLNMLGVEAYRINNTTQISVGFYHSFGK